ncbi:MAG TPA: hypothetical protein VJV96_14635 [Candidatus Angelobacter sp.]|jgi:hypothetical protein|nr:hypothetical protein [Candidatus Angelobacter sp.]
MARSSVTRRRFTLGVAAAATTALINPAQALEQAQNAASSQTGTLAAKAKAAMAKLSPAAQAEVEMKVASIFRKYGNRLNDEQKADIRRAMAETQDGLEKMRAFVLENGDQPATVLKLRREGEKD